MTPPSQHHSSNSDEYFNLALEYQESGDFLQAIREYSNAINEAPDMAIAYYNRGMSYYSLQKWNEGMEDITGAMNMDNMVSIDPRARNMKIASPEYSTPIVQELYEPHIPIEVRSPVKRPSSPPQDTPKNITILPPRKIPEKPPEPKEIEVEVEPEVVNVQVFKAFCPGCGAPLKLKGTQAIITCAFCGLESKVEMRLRKIEPEIPRFPPPTSPGNKENPYENWGTAQLVYGILTSEDTAEKILMAKALDGWFHVNDQMAGWVPDVVEVMLESEPELDRALAGIMGKLVCSDNLKHKQRVIQAGEKYGFRENGSKGLLFALSLGDAGTVKLLLDIGEWAACKGLKEYSEEALIGVQTAIGREASGGDLRVCMEVLTYRLPFVSGPVREWMMRFFRNHFDVGYTFLYSRFLELYDDCVFEYPDLIPGLQSALNRCGRADNREELYERLSVFSFLRSKEAKIAALESLGYPPNDVEFRDVEYLEKVLMPLTEDGDLKEAAVMAMKRFEY